MKVKCIATTGRDVSQKLIDLRGALRTTDYELTLGEIYPVYGITLWKGCLRYLIPDPQSPKGDPYWYPAELFQLEDNRLPNNWYFENYGENHKLGFDVVWGYKELTGGLDYLAGLEKRNAAALEVFFQRKKEVDEQLS
jgi:hypothetical protein